MTAESPARRFSQETTAVLSVGAAMLAAFIALAGLILVSTGRVADEARVERQALRAEAHAEREDLRSEIRATREELRAEMQTMRRELRAEMRAFQEAVREEMRAFRAEAQADRIAFAREIIRLTERQGHLDGLVEGLRSAPPLPAAPIAADS